METNKRTNAQTSKRFSGTTSRRDGMALVIVLGLIALLIISSVTFAILMRVERAGAANARNTIMARQVVKGALSYAIAAIENNATNRYPVMYAAGYDEVDNDPLNSQTIWHGMKASNWNAPYWSCFTDPQKPRQATTDTPREVRFWKDALGSVDHVVGKEFSNFRATARIMTQSAENYLPGGVRHRAIAENIGSSTDKVAPEWIPVATRMPKDDTDLGDVVGRYAFLAFDTTGAPDLTAIATKGNVDRGFGADPAEIQLVSGFFDGTTDSKKFKTKNESIKRFESISEIIAANPSPGVPGRPWDFDDGSVFAQGSSYSAYSYCPPDLAPRKSDTENDKTSEGKRFLEKINIGGVGNLDQLVHVKKHQARIMKAFYDSGLTKSSDGYSPGTIREDACDECGTAAYPLPDAYNSEQALWAYLGLIDYIDENNEPEGADDTEKFARPATENMPLFNGFMATVRFYVQEAYSSAPIPVPDGNGGTRLENALVFSTTNAIGAVEFDGKVVFANRTGLDISEDKALYASRIQGQIGFQFDGGGPATKKGTPTLAEAFFGAVDGGSYSDYDVDVAGNTATLRGPDTTEFDAGDPIPRMANAPYTFCLMATNRLELASALEAPEDSDKKEANKKKLLVAPDFVAAGASGATYNPAGKPVRLVPPDRAAFGGDFDPYIWLSSIYSPATEGRDGPDNWAELPGPGVKVYATRDEAIADLSKPSDQRKGPQYELRAWAYNVVLWGEMLDPRFLHAGAIEINTQEDVNIPRVAFASHRETGDGNSFEDFSIAGKISSESGFTGADELIDLMPTEANKADAANGDFEDFVSNFRSDSQFFGNTPYFSMDGNDGQGYYGQSAFQEFLLADPHALMPFDRDDREDEESSGEYTTFHGHTDGSSLADNHGGTVDDFDSQWHSSYSRDADMETVGELGHLPVGPWATIRLFGTEAETNVNLKINPRVSLFNGLPEQTYTMFVKGRKNAEAVHFKIQRPFHTVLDYFTLQNGPRFGLVNLNTPDPNVMASVFNGSPLCSEVKSDGEFVIGDDISGTKPLELASIFRATWLDVGKAGSGVQKDESTPFTRLSEMGWMFNDHDFDRAGLCKDHNHELRLSSNREREAVVCNSCGLFTTRGQTYTILLRGEAYSPLFGKTTVMDGDGTTLATRHAIAQIWRDTYEDDKGNHPVFVQFFKIFDE